MSIKYSLPVQGHVDLFSRYPQNYLSSDVCPPPLLPCTPLFAVTASCKILNKDTSQPKSIHFLAYLFWFYRTVNFALGSQNTGILKNVKFFFFLFFCLDKRKWLISNTGRLCFVFLSWNVISSHRELWWHWRGEWDAVFLFRSLPWSYFLLWKYLTFPPHLQW